MKTYPPFRDDYITMELFGKQQLIDPTKRSPGDCAYGKR